MKPVAEPCTTLPRKTPAPAPTAWPRLGSKTQPSTLTCGVKTCNSGSTKTPARVHVIEPPALQPPSESLTPESSATEPERR